MKNQYFQLVFRNDNAFLHIYPAIDGGESLDINEVIRYLGNNKFESYDLKDLNQKIQSGEESELMVGKWDKNEIDEMMDISVSFDKMKAVCRFYPASNGGKKIEVKEIIRNLVSNKIKFGIDQNKIYDAIVHHEFCKDYILAHGKNPIQGKDAEIKYYFNTNINLQPKRNEDGSVDYRELNTISHVKAGDLIAEIMKEDPGVSGQNIFGEEMKPRTVKTAKLEYSKNISVNDMKTELYSDVTGHASLVDGKVFVSNVYEVPADVDNSIGNIDYAGSVNVKGNVKAGFSIKAEGDVIVEGVVENAYIEAGGQIICKRGIHGMHKGVLKSQTNIIAKYIENATITAGGYVEAEIILNSDVSAGGAIRLHGKKGLANGGILRAGDCIEAENIGTEMGTITSLEVGIDPAKKVRYIDLQKETAKMMREMEENKVIIDNYSKKMLNGVHLPTDKMKYVQKLASAFKVKQLKLEDIKEEMQSIREEMLEADQCYVAVNHKAYPGVIISISDLNYNIKEEMRYCKFKKQDGEIHTVPM